MHYRMKRGRAMFVVAIVTATTSRDRGARLAKSERRVLNGKALLLAAVAAVVAAWGAHVTRAGATQPPCVVANSRAHQTYGTLQEAVNGAVAGAKLTVKGTCVGDTSIAENLTITGQASGGFGPPTLSGANTAGSPGSVLVDHEAKLTLTGLTITGGYNDERARQYGGAITNPGAEKGGGIYSEGGTLKLTHCTVSGNTATFSGKTFEGETFGGGGIFTESGSVTLSDSSVTGNSGLGPGGGIDNDGGSVKITHSNVSENQGTGSDRGEIGAFSGAGIANSGELTLTSSTVEDNSGLEGSGGGISNGGTLTVTKSTISGNTIEEGFGGGGITNSGALTLTDSSVADNSVMGTGGGLQNGADGSVTLKNSDISGNTAEDGGGIYNGAALTLSGSSSVTGNKASVQGGGIYENQTEGGTIAYAKGWSGTVSGNEPDDIFIG
jgi:hypothetical protein